MLKLQNWYGVGVAGALGVWLLAFLLGVSPAWSEREVEERKAKEFQDQLLALCAPSRDQQGEEKALPAAEADLARREAVLKEVMQKVSQIEAGAKLDEFAFAEAKRDPGGENNYFDRKRNELRSEIRGANIKVPPELEDLGFRGELTKDREQISPNLVRLFVLRRFLFAARKVGVDELVKLQYAALKPLEPEKGLELKSRLVQVPLLISVRLPERNLLALLSELQQPTLGMQSFFSLRGLQLIVKDKERATGTFVANMALCALFSEAVLKEQANIAFAPPVGTKTERPAVRAPLGAALPGSY